MIPNTIKQEQEISELLSRGYVQESGSNSNGNYIKFSDGTMICYKITDIIEINIDIAWGSLFENSIDMGQFPANFTETPAISILPFGSGMLIEQAGANATLSSWGLVTVVRPTAVQNVRARFYMIAIGKWK